MADNSHLEQVCSFPPPPPEGAETVRCGLCNKPLVKGTTIEHAGQHFCTRAACNQCFASQSNFDEQAARDAARKRAKMIRNLILLVIVVALAVGGLFCYNKNKDAIDKKAGELREQLK